MSSYPPFPIFNSPTANGDAAFYVFPRLPKELRLVVWRHALRRERIIRLHLTDPDFEDAETALQRINPRIPDDQKRGCSGRYNIMIQGHQVLSKCLRVCRESREETLAFYRVHIPCQFARVPKEADRFGIFILKETFENRLKDSITPGSFYCNPDWDFLHITCFPDANALIPPFLHDLKTQYDPRSIGLRNLLIADLDSTQTGVWENIQDLDPTKLSPPLKDSVEHTLRQLDELIIRTTTKAGRVTLGFFSNISSSTFFNRSVPITTNIPAFDRIAIDPRNISKDLEKTFMGEHGDWRTKFTPFTSLLSRFGILPTKTTTQFKFMLSIDGYQEVCSREDAQAWLKHDYEMWWTRPDLWPPCDRSVFEGQEYIMDVLPAFGFWLFSLEKSVGIAKVTEGWQSDIFDMRTCVPELGVSYMPGE
jgi:hypothetical protein